MGVIKGDTRSLDYGSPEVLALKVYFLRFKVTSRGYTGLRR